MTTVAPQHFKEVRRLWDGAIIDADVHAEASLDALAPFLSMQWNEFMRERGFREVGGVQGVLRAYPDAPSSAMAEWVPQDGRRPASDLGLLRGHVLDHLDVDFAVANCYFGLDSVRHPDFAAALASAVNDWLIEEWLSKDKRLRASLVVPPRHPAAMMREIERVGGHPGFVQVLMPVRSDRLYGNRNWHPLLDVIASHDLVFGLHFGGTGDAAPTATGFPNHYFTEYAGEPALYWAQITSLIAEGAFQQVPSLRVSVLEGGFTWLPSLAWRLTKEWKGLRRDVPWVDRPPIDLIRDHMRFSVAPLDAGTPEDLEATVRHLGTDELLMFATDYPHWHDDDVATLLGAVPEQARAKLMAENARAWYRLPTSPPSAAA
jgi:predicted TIM-barrel fold metal-dependent hydrolase